MNKNPVTSDFNDNFSQSIGDAPCNFAWAQHVMNAAIPTLGATVAIRQILDKLKDRVLPSEREEFDAAIATYEQAISLWRGKGRVAPETCEQCIHKNSPAEQTLQHIVDPSFRPSLRKTRHDGKMKSECTYFARSSVSCEAPSGSS